MILPKVRDPRFITIRRGAAYAIKAVRAAAPRGDAERVGRVECRWQRDQLSDAIRELVLDDQRLRNDICWSVFDC